jgi:hypothetical protein
MSMSVDGVINTLLVEEWALPCDMLWGTEGGTAWACESFGGVCGPKLLGVGACECVVNCKLKCSGSGAAGVSWMFCFLALQVFLYGRSDGPEWVVVFGQRL